MDRRRILLIGFVACFLALTTVLANSTAPSASLTVGDFAVLVASKMNPGDTQGPLTPATAADLLRKHGMNVSADLTSPLTEKEAASLFGQLGIALQTEHPEALLSPERAASLVGIFGGNLASTGARTDATLASKTASTTGAPTLETTPYDCQSLPKPPAPAWDRVGMQPLHGLLQDLARLVRQDLRTSLPEEEPGRLPRRADTVSSGHPLGLAEKRTSEDPGCAFCLSGQPTGVTIFG